MPTYSTAKIAVDWEDPPPLKYPSRGATAEIIENVLPQLKAKPNTWAKIGTFEGEHAAYAMRSRLRKAGVTEYGRDAAGKYEFEVRKDPGKGSILYARYIVKAPAK